MRGKLKLFFAPRLRQLQTAAVLGALGLAYYGFCRLTGLSIPCVFHAVTGLACPGCGATHFFLALARLDFAAAAQENLALAVLLPVWGTGWLIDFLIRPRWLHPRSRAVTAATWVSVALLLSFGVVRNLPGCAFLLPLYMR